MALYIYIDIYVYGFLRCARISYIYIYTYVCMYVMYIQGVPQPGIPGKVGEFKEALTINHPYSHLNSEYAFIPIVLNRYRDYEGDSVYRVGKFDLVQIL